jgi:hypothetical protein
MDRKEEMPPSLTGEELQKIWQWERTHQSKVLRRALWEVRRLQAVALRADQLLRSLNADSASLDFNSAHIVVNELRRLLDQLPLISERRKEREELLYPNGKKKGIGER